MKPKEALIRGSLPVMIFFSSLTGGVAVGCDTVPQLPPQLFPWENPGPNKDELKIVLKDLVKENNLVWDENIKATKEGIGRWGLVTVEEGVPARLEPDPKAPELPERKLKKNQLVYLSPWILEISGNKWLAKQYSDSEGGSAIWIFYALYFQGKEFINIDRGK